MNTCGHCTSDMLQFCSQYEIVPDVVILERPGKSKTHKVGCLMCKKIWRTNAAYLKSVPEATGDQRRMLGEVR